jgi:mRNA interferase YafQ
LERHGIRSKCLKLFLQNCLKKDLKKYQHKKDIIKELYDVISTLYKEKSLDISKKDHSLVGNYVNYRECHVRNDLLLIYKVDKKTSSLYLARFGSHSEVF